MKLSKKKRNRNSSLEQHQRIGKTLLPPMMQVAKQTNLEFSSWIDTRLPELLWACLVISTIPRNSALAIFRKIANLGFMYRNNAQNNISQWELTHSCLAILPDEIFLGLIEIITQHPLGYAALRPLLLLDTLPGKERWAISLACAKQTSDWQTIRKAIAITLNHQSEESTDIRWMLNMFKAVLGQITITSTMSKMADELVNYPNKGDMRSVQSKIRAMEIAIRRLSLSDTNTQWNNAFWLECLKRTNCISLPTEQKKELEYDHNVVSEKFKNIQLLFIQHWFNTIETSAVDARHDTIFGFGFYSLALFIELLMATNHHRQGITGRLILRTLTEIQTTLAYLLIKNDPELWIKFRKFGTGQAKLALLKLLEAEGEKPAFINKELLEQIVNEDMYQEFVNIELGNWCNLDLRKIAEISNTKDDYDKYYGWTSTYSHAHWPAIRDVCFTTCLNPLHRLHRVPLIIPRLLDDTIPDAIFLINKILAQINTAYPGFSEIL